MMQTIPCNKSVKLSSVATYLIIGGLGGIGRAYAQWVIDHGAKNLILLSRNAASSVHSIAIKKKLSVGGAHVTLRNCDAVNLESLKAVLGECANSMPPVRGIIHGGMLLNDSVLESMTPTQWTDATAAKVTATQNLDRLFPGAGDLDFFIMLSSAFGVIGSASQANYTAGGTFQDAVARRRASAGLPGITIDLGMVHGVGYVADNKTGVADRLLASGHRPLRKQDIFQLLDYCVRHPVRTPRTAQLVTGLASSAVRKQSWGKEWRFAALDGHDACRSDSSHSKPGTTGSDATRLRETLSSASTAEEARNLVEDAVVDKLADMFVIPKQDIDASQPLSKYGVDSLVAVELRNWLVPSTQCELSIFDLLRASSLRDLAETIATRSMALRIS